MKRRRRQEANMVITIISPDGEEVGNERADSEC